MNKDLIKNLRRLRDYFINCQNDPLPESTKLYMRGICKGLEIAIQEISERDLEQAYTDKCAENAQDCTDLTETPEKTSFETWDHVPESITTDMEILSCLSDEESEQTSGEPAEEDSAILPEDCTESLKFNPYKGSNMPEEILEYLSKVSVEILDSASFDSLMNILERKTNSMWGPSSSPTSHRNTGYIFPDALSIYPDISFVHEKQPITFSVAMDLLRRLPDKD